METLADWQVVATYAMVGLLIVFMIYTVMKRAWQAHKAMRQDPLEEVKFFSRHPSDRR